ncbi:MAG: hypothetical protein KBS41_04560, partial [Oscillospiraceae bacterium]|nr:hypothetical protein [Candidatus Equicaccousia limihippi]
DFKTEYRLAKTVTLEGDRCSVIIKPAVFSDGSTLTPEDVVFSYKKAIASKTSYKYALEDVKSVKITGSDSLVFELSKKDPFFVSVLDFPILKKGSDQLKNSDNKPLPPIGTGRYILADDLLSLNCNKNYFAGTVGLPKIGLVDSPDDESNYQNAEAGIIDYYYSDLSSTLYPKMKGKTVSVNLSNIVFLGVNKKNRYLSKDLFLQSVSSVIDRTDICVSSYYGNATPALSPYPSCFEPAKDYQNLQASPNIESAKQNFTKMGYTKKGADGYYLNGDRTVSVTLAVNQENSVRVAAAEKIAASLSAFGIKCTLIKEPYATYNARIQSGNYDLYLGEIRLLNNMDITKLLGMVKQPTSSTATTSSNQKNVTSKTAASKTSNTSSVSSKEQKTDNALTCNQAITKFYKGEITLGDLVTVCNSELPVIPICHRKGLVSYSENVNANLAPSASDLFYGFENIRN